MASWQLIQLSINFIFSVTMYQCHQHQHIHSLKAHHSHVSSIVMVKILILSLFLTQIDHHIASCIPVLILIIRISISHEIRPTYYFPNTKSVMK